ncbi:MAG TPA: 4Fe-4S dicluster domain-containing protein [Bacteroidales bacterium]|nr:4Fe-4S dicluster domain-containing protein [Bacteroidales bacterium]
MAIRVNPGFINDLNRFGKENIELCYQCGDCSAVCPHSDEFYKFPRKPIRLLQMGLEKKVETTLEPWLCYYCGDCSDLCPRDANPGDTMMILRRYLTSVYDWTGLSRKFYTSHWWEIGAVFVIGILIALLFSAFNPHGIVTTLTPDGGVKINEMFPVETVNIGAHIMLISIASFLIANIIRMWYLTLLKDRSVRIPFTLYFRKLYQLFVHFLTQKQFIKCKDRSYWIFHLLLMSAYVLMFVLIVGNLRWFQTDRIYSWYQPQRLLGYYSTLGLLAGLAFFSWGRIRKIGQKFKFSHLSDWIFIILLFLTTTSGILLHFFRLSGMPVASYYTYIIHMAVLVPMLCVEVPFSKWSHLAYRPFAIYFAEIKKSALPARKKNDA